MQIGCVLQTTYAEVAACEQRIQQAAEVKAVADAAQAVKALAQAKVGPIIVPIALPFSFRSCRPMEC